MRIAAYFTSGKSGDVIFANVTYKAVGAAGSTSTLNITVDSVFDIDYTDISHSIENGSLSLSVEGEGEFDTGAGTYPSISGIHEGFIIPNRTIEVREMYTYPCAGTGGHTEYVRICNLTSSSCRNTTWNGYQEDYRNISFSEQFTLTEGGIYNYTIKTGSYPQIIHNQTHTTSDGSVINCTKFEDANGKRYNDWIPAFRLY